jgi:hypothetical protein
VASTFFFPLVDRPALRGMAGRRGWPTVKETPESYNVSALRVPASEIGHKELHLPLLDLDTNTPLL